MANYFNLLNIEKKYEIDLKILNQQYLTMRSKYHPDRAKNNVAKQHNVTISIDLDKAYSVLKDDLSRAIYLLSLHHIEFDDVTIRHRLSNIQLNSIWNELEIVENIAESASLKQVYNQKILQQKTEIAALNIAFQEQNLQEALDITIRLKYLKNLIDNIRLKIKSCK